MKILNNVRVFFLPLLFCFALLRAGAAYSQEDTRNELGVRGGFSLKDNQDGPLTTKIQGPSSFFFNVKIMKYLKTGFEAGYLMGTIHKENSSDIANITIENTFNMYLFQYSVTGILPITERLAVNLSFNTKFMNVKNFAYYSYDDGFTNEGGYISEGDGSEPYTLSGDRQGFNSQNERTYGMECGLSYRISRKLTLTGSFANLDLFNSLKLSGIEDSEIPTQGSQNVYYFRPALYTPRLVNCNIALSLNFGKTRF